ncbi:hypothetical protein JT358_11670 [Micrococcales bacterium 31B]|nr:hypothetical protein [Micrococcales bacterium 31B]
MDDRQLTFTVHSPDLQVQLLHAAARSIGTMPWRLEYNHAKGDYAEHRLEVALQARILTEPGPNIWGRVVKLLWRDLDATIHQVGRTICQSCGRPVIVGESKKHQSVAVDVWRHPEGQWEIESASQMHLALRVVPEHLRSGPHHLFRDHALTCESRSRRKDQR